MVSSESNPETDEKETDQQLDDVETFSTSSSQSEAAGEDALPSVREHSYLPGTSHPLHSSEVFMSSESDLDDTSRHSQFGLSSSFRGFPFTELPVLELPGVILFPGSTFPLRFSHESAWMEHLGRQIEANRRSPGQAQPVRLGILTKRQPEAELTPRMQERRHWTRQTLGPVHLRRLSEQVIREIDDAGGLSTSSSESEADESEDNAPHQQERETGILPTGVLVRVRGLPLRDERPLPAARRVRRVNSSGSDRSPRRRITRDRYGNIDRVGTIVTVTCTHGDEADDSDLGSFSRVWRSIQEGGQLVLTCLATGRFRITGYAGSDETHDMFRQGAISDPTSVVRTFYVEEFDDKPLPLPPLNRPFASLPSRLSRGGSSSGPQYNQMVHSLSMVSSVPEFVYENHWPWRLVSLIKESMARSQTFAPFLDALPSDGSTAENGFRKEEDPVQLSFWMASNLPFSQQEKVRLLEMHSTDERLRFIYEKVVREERLEPCIHCKVCSVPLARSVTMFTVGGAEGTTGAYVNNHGFIHQTITVRHLNEDDVILTGGPQTQDSWFPGYSWTIMSCSVCFHHLGWKFERVPGYLRLSRSKDRPEFFYGLSGSSVKVIVPELREREST